MEPDEYQLKTLVTATTRHRCVACFKQYKKKEHLIAHMKTSNHSIHQPKCGVCQKHCKSFESLREHITGRLAKENCSKIFTERGCKLCMRIFDSSVSLSTHQEICFLPAPAPIVSYKAKFYIYYHVNKQEILEYILPLCPQCKVLDRTGRSFRRDEKGTIMMVPHLEYQIDNPPGNIENVIGFHPEAVAIDCEMVGGGSDGSLDLCARVCLVDEDEKLIFHTYVVPQIPVTNYRYEVTGVTEDHLRYAMPLKEVQSKILQILYNGESIGRLRLNGGKARVLVGHGLEHDLDCLRMNYPDHLLRDTAKYPPLMKTNLVSHSLKYLVKTYLGYDIQLGMHDPYEDCVSVMRLYKRLRSQEHQPIRTGMPLAARSSPSLANTNEFGNYKDLVNLTPDELFGISKSNYKCWCLDLEQILHL